MAPTSLDEWTLSPPSHECCRGGTCSITLGWLRSFLTGLPSATPPLLCILYLHPDFSPQSSAFLCLFSETFSDFPWPPNSESSRLQLAFKHLLQFGLNLALHSTLLTSTTWYPSFPGTFILPGECPTVYCTLTVGMLELQPEKLAPPTLLIFTLPSKPKANVTSFKHFNPVTQT